MPKGFPNALARELDDSVTVFTGEKLAAEPKRFAVFEISIEKVLDKELTVCPTFAKLKFYD